MTSCKTFIQRQIDHATVCFGCVFIEIVYLVVLLVNLLLEIAIWFILPTPFQSYIFKQMYLH